MISEKLPNDSLNKIITKKHVYSAVMRVENEDASFV